jgi:enoyl-CoA hydratase
MGYETLELSYDDAGQIATLTVSRPDQLNALNEQVVEDLNAATAELEDNDALRALVVTGAGRAFVAGADIKAMLDFDGPEAIGFAREGHRALDALSQLPFPVIAAVNGYALGGGLELALACDLIYASDKAVFGLPEVGLGIIPGFGGTQRLGRTVGWHRARDLVFSGRHVKADEARDIGLALDVFPHDEFTDKITEVAETIASNGPIAVSAAKRVMREGAEMTLENGNETERREFGDLFATDDRREGMQAFLEKRDADFKGE